MAVSSSAWPTKGSTVTLFSLHRSDGASPPQGEALPASTKFKRLLRRTRPRFARAPRSVASLLSLGLVAASLSAASLVGVAAPAQAADAVGCGYGTGGNAANNLCWLDMSSYNDQAARTSAGQNMSATLPGGYTFTYTIKTTTPSGNLSVPARATESPTYSGAYMGNNAYVGIPGKPALGYVTTAASAKAVSFTLSNLVVKDSSGATVSGWGMAVSDAEATGPSGLGAGGGPAGQEYIQVSSDVVLNRIDIPDPSLPTCAGGLTGVGTTNVSCRGEFGSTGAPRYGAVVLQATQPSTITGTIGDTNGSGGGEDIAFAFVTSRLTLDKTVDGRISPSDSFDITTTSPEGTVIATASTGTSNSASTGGQVVLPRASGTGAYTFAEAGGAGTDLSKYDQSWSCTNATTTSTTTLPSGSGTTQTVEPEAGDDITCVVTNTSRAFTVSKTADRTSVKQGEVLTYTVAVKNTGNAAYTADRPASFTDDLSAVLDDATYNNDASDGATVAGNSLSWSGALAVGETKNITYSVTVNNPDTGDKILTNAVTPENGGTCDPAGSCTTDTPVKSYTIKKSVDATKVTPGDTVTYTVTIENTGKVDYTTESPVAFTDDLSNVTDDATYNNDATNGATVSGNTLSWSGPLAIGASQTFTYSFTVNNPDAGDKKLTNAVVPNDPAACAPGACTTTVPSGEYTTKKVASAASAKPGDTVTYTVTVTNTGEVDYDAQKPATFTDDLSGVTDDATYNGDASTGATVSGNTLSWSGTLAIGETKTVTYSVTVNSPDAGDHRLKNSVVPTTPGGRCTAANDCVTDTPVSSFTTSKTADKSSVDEGGVVTYTVTVTNTGQVDYTDSNPASFTDDLSQVIDDAVYNGDATNGATVNGNTLSWSGPLAIGATTTVTYSFTVNTPDTGDKKLTNTVVPVGPDGGCTTVGGCTTDTLVSSFTTSKSVDKATAKQGETVTYTVTVTNTGQTAYTDEVPAGFSDDLSMVTDDATYNGDATNGAVVNGNTLTWSGALAVGETKTITYSVTVNTPDTGDRQLQNVVVPSKGGACDPVDSCTTDTLVKSYTIKKTVDATEVTPGQTITYTVTVENTGQVAYTDADPIAFTDDLSQVTDDATYNNDATNGATVDGNTLSWSGPLAIGATRTFTYSFTVNTPDAGDKKLINAVVPNDPTACVGECGTQVPGGEYTVSKKVDKSVVELGDTVTYTVSVVNTGKTDYTDVTPASFSDDLSKVTDDATYNGDAAVTYSGSSVGANPTVSGNTVTWSGPLQIGETATITYSFTVNNPATGDNTLTNVVVPTGKGGECETEGGCTTDTLVGSYTVAKTVDKNTAVAGDVVKYTITVTNTGASDYTDASPASFTDDLSKVTDDATYNGDASNGATVSGNTLSWKGALAAGNTVTVTYSFTVNNPDMGDLTLENVVDPGAGTCATDGGCATNTTVTPKPTPHGPTVATGGTAVGAAALWPLFGGAGAAVAALIALLAMAAAGRRRQNGDSV